ncbi:MAG: globin [Ilumatobacteraceae bacterium]
MTDTPSIHGLVGTSFFVGLVDRFYDGVESDPVLLPLYPEGSDTDGARERLAMFLVQYWGGPHDYMERRGHPMLRARHNQWTIGPRERDRWLVHMLGALNDALEDSTLGADARERVLAEVSGYMVNAAEHLRNAD